ncbi:MAG: hypothetical protein JW737_05195 [Acidobacteria bacterium]|nr:hypothetical protein [Acidobacteriota bacterium]
MKLDFKRQYPKTAIALNNEGLSLATYIPRKNLAQVYTQEFSEDLFHPEFTVRNITSPDTLKQSITYSLKKLDVRSKRISLILPDSVSRLFIFDFDDLPSKGVDLENLIKFKLKKIIPFEIDSAQVSYQWAQNTEGKHNFQVGVMYKPVIEQYQEIFAELGLDLGLIDIKSNNLINLYNALESHNKSPRLYLSVGDNYMSILLENDSEYLLYRSKTLPAQNRTALIEREIRQSVMYWFDRLSGKITPTVIILESTDDISKLKINIEDHDIEILKADYGRILPDINFYERRPERPSYLGAVAASMRSYL